MLLFLSIIGIFVPLLEIGIAGLRPTGVQFYGLAGGYASISENMVFCSCMLLLDPC